MYFLSNLDFKIVPQEDDHILIARSGNGEKIQSLN